MLGVSQTSRNLLASGLASAMVIPCLYTFYTLIFNPSFTDLLVIFLLTMIVCILHLVVLGLPLFLLLKRWDRLTRSLIVLCGFVIGFAPAFVANFYWLGDATGTHSSYVDGRLVYSIKDGVPTMHMWRNTALVSFFFGCCGALSALVFWLCWSTKVDPSENL